MEMGMDGCEFKIRSGLSMMLPVRCSEGAKMERRRCYDCYCGNDLFDDYVGI